MSKFMIDQHMGRTHIDPAVFSWAVKEFKVSSMLDVGCGPAGMKDLADRFKVAYTGIDGDPTLKNPAIIYHDFTTGKIELPKVDLCWSVEFVEHVYEQYMENFIDAFKCAKYLIMTFAPPGKKGRHHVNLQPESYWITTLENNGFKHCTDYTSTVRRISSMKREFMRNTGLVFKNENYNYT